MFQFHTGLTEWKHLLLECAAFKRSALADSTKSSYNSMKKAYLRFCLYFGRTPVPACQLTLTMYAAFLARTLSGSSIVSYLNIVKLMHEEQGLSDPLDSWDLKMVKRGIQRKIGKPPNQKLPITTQLLSLLHGKLDFSQPITRAFWAACLVAFFGFLRKSTLLPKSLLGPEVSKALCISDVAIQPSKTELLLRIRHTKTIQFGQRLLQLPLIAIPGSKLCPVSAVISMLANISVNDMSVNQPLFSFMSNAGMLTALTHSQFVNTLKYYLKMCNIDCDRYSGHSFRRGGCSYAFSLGISPVLIKLRGDWKSNAYERYVHVNEEQHKMLAYVMSKSIVDG